MSNFVLLDSNIGAMEQQFYQLTQDIAINQRLNDIAMQCGDDDESVVSAESALGPPPVAAPLIPPVAASSSPVGVAPTPAPRRRFRPSSSFSNPNPPANLTVNDLSDQLSGINLSHASSVSPTTVTNSSDNAPPDAQYIPTESVVQYRAQQRQLQVTTSEVVLLDTIKNLQEQIRDLKAYNRKGQPLNDYDDVTDRDVQEELASLRTQNALMETALAAVEAEVTRGVPVTWPPDVQIKGKKLAGNLVGLDSYSNQKFEELQNTHLNLVTGVSKLVKKVKSSVPDLAQAHPDLFDLIGGSGEFVSSVMVKESNKRIQDLKKLNTTVGENKRLKQQVKELKFQLQASAKGIALQAPAAEPRHLPIVREIIYSGMSVPDMLNQALIALSNLFVYEQKHWSKVFTVKDNTNHAQITHLLDSQLDNSDLYVSALECLVILRTEIADLWTNNARERHKALIMATVDHLEDFIKNDRQRTVKMTTEYLTIKTAHSYDKDYINGVKKQLDNNKQLTKFVRSVIDGSSKLCHVDYTTLTKQLKAFNILECL
ncbi:protein ORF23 [Lake sturgeon herpesvirus]|nr:protein ORF23 [Lake sturgeon herpesvirus]